MSMFSENDESKVKAMAATLGIPFDPELMQLGSTEEISSTLLQLALSMGKSEDEISSALGV